MSYTHTVKIKLPVAMADIAAAIGRALSKTCTCCGAEKLASDYYTNGSKVMSQCKDCWKAKVKARADLKPKARRYKITSEAEVTREMVEHYFTYDSESGMFTRRIGVGGMAPSGSPAGTLNDSGYVVICMAGRDIRAHRLVWFMEHGEFPEDGLVIDHINRNPSDNRISNLRAVPQKLNAYNIVNPKKGNKLGVLGVHRNKKRFSARIYSPSGEALHLGTFDTVEIARGVYLDAKQSFYPEAVIA